MIRAKSVEHIAAVLLLVLIAIAASLLVWLGLLGHPKPRPPETCRAAVEAYRVNQSGLYIWIRSLKCDVKIDVAYLKHADGSLAALLHPHTGRVRIPEGDVRLVRLLPDKPVPVGDYILEIPLVDDPIVVELRVSKPVAAAAPVVSGSLADVNGTVIEMEGYRVLINVSIYQPEYNTYNVTVWLCAKPGYMIYYARIEVYNATWKPPMWIGKWYVYEESPDELPYTYPDCSMPWFAPFDAIEQPIHIIAMAYYRRG